MERLSFLRDIYLSYWKQYPTDFLLVLDMDLGTSFPEWGIMSSVAVMKEQPQVEALCSNGMYKTWHNFVWWRWHMYDTYAYESVADPIEELFSDKREIHHWLLRFRHNPTCSDGALLFLLGIPILFVLLLLQS